MRYRRARVKGGTFFFTVVTYNRKRFLCDAENLDILRDAFRYVKKRHPFAMDAFVLLPDHIHCIWTLPEEDMDFSTRWRLIKTRFTRKVGNLMGVHVSPSRQSKKEQPVWQRRFWEHTITNEKDFADHIHYIHYNPVKHGYVAAAKGWPHSSFHGFVKKGWLPLNWAAGKNMDVDVPIGME